MEALLSTTSSKDDKKTNQSNVAPPPHCMDNANQKATRVLKEEGEKAFVAHCFNPTGKKQLTYAEMRERFG